MSVLLGGGTKVVSAVSGAGVVFQDTFASGDFSHTQNGVTWNPTFWVSVVDQPQIARNGNSKMVRFRYGTGEGGNISELRWQGMADQTEVFIQYYLYIPNGSESPSVGAFPTTFTGTPTNNKFLRVYEGTGINSLSSVGASWYGSNGEVGIEYRLNTGSDLWGIGLRESTAPPALMTDAAYRGRWTRIRFQYRLATSANNDGIYRVWYDDTLVLEKTNVANYPYDYVNMVASRRWNGGYLFGAMNNDAPPAQSYLYITDFSVSSAGFP